MSLAVHGHAAKGKAMGRSELTYYSLASVELTRRLAFILPAAQLIAPLTVSVTATAIAGLAVICPVLTGYPFYSCYARVDDFATVRGRGSLPELYAYSPECPGRGLRGMSSTLH
jgi:hypothetical protein